MPSEWSWWLGNRDVYLRERAEELEGALASQAAAARQRETALARQTGSLEQRLNRLTELVDALAELGDLREELDLFIDARQARRGVQDLLVSLGAFGGADGAVVGAANGSVAPPDDVPEYWLTAAARGLLDVVDGGDEAGSRALVEARRRDDARTTDFVALVLALVGRADADEIVAPSHLVTLLPDTASSPVTVLQRAIWTAAAGGALGKGGREAVAAWLAHISSNAARTVDETAQMWAGRRSVPRAARPDVRGLPVETRTKLQKLADCEAILSRLRVTREAVGSGVAGDWRTGFQAAVVRLVDEGSPVERPIVRRMGELRRLTTSAAAAESRRGLVDPDASAGELIDLVDGDLLDEGADPALTTLAWEAMEPAIIAVARLLAEQVAVDEHELTVTMRIGAAEVLVDGSPLPATAADAAEAAALERFPLPSGLLKGLRGDDDESARAAEAQRLAATLDTTRASVAELRRRVAEQQANVAASLAVIAAAD
jgi:hypothetical protein